MMKIVEYRNSVSNQDLLEKIRESENILDGILWMQERLQNQKKNPFATEIDVVYIDPWNKGWKQFAMVMDWHGVDWIYVIENDEIQKTENKEEDQFIGNWDGVGRDWVK